MLLRRIGLRNRKPQNRGPDSGLLHFAQHCLPSVDSFAKSGVINFNVLNNFADKMAKKLGVKTSSLDLEAGALSGGNQQKVVIAKWVGRHPEVIIMDEPTLVST